MLTLLACAWLLIADATPMPAMPAPFAAARFRQHVAYLASDELEGRNVGSAGSAKAMQYLVRHFQQAGLKGLASDKLEGQDDWFQEFPYSFPQGGQKVTARNVVAVFPGRGTLANEAIIVAGGNEWFTDPSNLRTTGTLGNSVLTLGGD